MSKPTWIMGRDQYGETYHDLGPHPRKALMEKLGSSRAEKMYIDRPLFPEHKEATGVVTEHIGYVVAGRWITLYEVRPWQRS